MAFPTSPLREIYHGQWSVDGVPEGGWPVNQDRSAGPASAGSELFELNDSRWREIVAAARNMHMPAGTVLMESGEQCPGFMLLTKGCVRVFQYAEDGRELTLYRLEPGDVCVMSLHALIAQSPFEAVASAESDIHALVLSPAQFAAALEQCAAFRNHVLLHMTNRYCDMLSLVQESAFKHLDLRLACLLVNRAEQGGHTLHTTHQELARELGTTREVISRLLKEMERAGCLQLARGRIDIGDIAALRRFRQTGT